MCGLNGSEFLIIVVVAVLVLGPDRLPELMRLLGRGVREVRTVTRGFTDVQKEIRSKVSVDELRRQIREELLLEERETNNKRQSMQSEADAVRARKAARAAAAAVGAGAVLTDASEAAATDVLPATDAVQQGAGVDDEGPLPEPPVSVRPARDNAPAAPPAAPPSTSGEEPG
jgi:sec-independent protein translocase protein TatB